jgi:ubiquinone/menaquinone biosynthesis C-methylase UbiE
MNVANEVTHDALADATIHKHWVSAYRTPEAQQFYEMAFDKVAAKLAAPPDAVILDAGCGSCAKSILLASRGFRVVGTDFSADALAIAEQTIRDQKFGDRITLRQGDVTSLPFRNAEFQYAVCWGVLMHIPEFQKAVAELARVLAPGGQLVISEGNMSAMQAVALRSLKRLLGRNRNVVRTPGGLESHEDTDHGKLVTRQLDMPWFVRECERHGLRLKTRMSGQFTEIYVLLPWRWARSVVHRFNSVWFRFVGAPGPAFANILIFEKKA